MQFSFEGKVSVVTGGSQGIGREIATALSKAGAIVVITDKLEPLELSDEMTFMQVDLYDSTSIEQVIDAIICKFSKIDILVNCAGVYPSKPAVAISESEWDAVIDLNLKVPFLLSQLVAKDMIRKNTQGSIVNIASTAAQNARPGVAHYCSSKAGLVMLTRVLALEWAPYQIRVNAVCPGLVETETLMRSLATSTLVREHEEKIEKVPLQRAANPAEIAEAVLMLADNVKSGYITGQALYVDGGYTAGQTFATFREQMDEVLNR